MQSIKYFILVQGSVYMGGEEGKVVGVFTENQYNQGALYDYLEAQGYHMYEKSMNLWIDQHQETKIDVQVIEAQHFTKDGINNTYFYIPTQEEIDAHAVMQEREE